MAPPRTAQRQVQEDARFYVGYYSPPNQNLEILLRFFAPDGSPVGSSKVKIVAPNGRTYEAMTDRYGQVLFKPPRLGRYYVSIQDYHLQFNSFKLSPSPYQHDTRPRISQKQPKNLQTIPESATAKRRELKRSRQSRQQTPARQVPIYDPTAIAVTYRTGNYLNYTLNFRSLGSQSTVQRGVLPWISEHSTQPAALAGRTAIIETPDKSLMYLKILPNGTVNFTARKYGIYRLVSIQGFNRFNQLAINVDEKRIANVMLTQQKRRLLAIYGSNSGMRAIITAIYAYYLRKIENMTNRRQIAIFNLNINRLQSRVEQVARLHLAAKSAIARNFGNSPRSSQLLGSANTGLESILYKVLAGGDTILYTKFIRFVNNYAIAVRELKRVGMRKSSLSSAALNNYGVLYDKVARSYNKALRNIAQFDPAELATLTMQIKGIAA